MVARLIIGLGLTVLAAAIAGRRGYWLYRLMRSGQPEHGRTERLGERLRAQLVEVFGQPRLLRWSVPGVAHFFTFWGFVILLTVYVEAYGALFDEDFHIPLIGRWPALGFLQDFFALAVLVAHHHVRGDPASAGAGAAGSARPGSTAPTPARPG